VPWVSSMSSFTPLSDVVYKAQPIKSEEEFQEPSFSLILDCGPRSHVATPREGNLRYDEGNHGADRDSHDHR
jgi:hypothetical protein